VAFPPSYRRFLTELGKCDIEGREFYGVWRRRDDPRQLMGTVADTLDERRDAEMPVELIAVQHDGMGGYYVLNTARLDDEGEAPVFVYLPPWVTSGEPLEYIAPNFGTLALA
jgi:hypothetical protein